MRIFAVGLIFLNLLYTCHGVVNIDEETRQLIDEFVRSVIFDCRRHDIVSMNLAVVHRGEVAYTTAYGVKDLETGENATENSVYAIASVSKHFTSLLLGQVMKEEGSHTWNTPVRDILGGGQYFADPLRTNLSRPRDLASHSLGIPRNDAAIMSGPTRAELAERLRFIPGTTEPRTNFVYNNLMYHMLGHITESISGQNWEQLMQTRLFDPVGMTNTYLNYMVDKESIDLAKPYKLDNREFREVDLDVHVSWMKEAGGAGAILSTANDMARWMNMMVQEGRVDGTQVVDSDVLDTVATPVNAHLFNPARSITVKPRSTVTWESGYYGLGLYKGSYRGYRVLSHGGALDGHYTQMYTLPDVDLGVYMTISGIERSDTSTPIFAYIADLMLGYEPWLNTTTGCRFPLPFFDNLDEFPKPRDFQTDAPTIKKPSKPVKLSRKFLKQNEGLFGNFGYGNISVILDAETPELTLEYGDIQRYRVLPLTGPPDISFYAQGLDPVWEYVLGPIVFREGGDLMDITFNSLEGPITFQRGLLASDAPEPGFDVC